MHTENDKIIYTAEDFEKTVKHFGQFITSNTNVALFSIYQGSLSLGHRLSKEYNLPHSILKYQRYDGTDDEVQVLYDARDREEYGTIIGAYHNHDIFIIDDVFDSGKTMEVCYEFTDEWYSSKTLNCFTIFSNKVDPDLHFEHFNPEGKWVQFEPWEGKSNHQ